MTVNEGLAAYIRVHNSIFKEAASFTSLLKNLFGRGVPMSKLLENAERLVPIWDSISLEMETFRRTTHSSLSKDEKYYFDILSRYAVAVRRTVAALVDRQRLMADGSKSRSNNPVTLDACRQKEEIYQKAIQEYTKIGQELNAASPIIFG